MTSLAVAPRSVPRVRVWVFAHVASLLFVAAVLVYCGRGQWFYYDEWDFLAVRDEWSLLAPHNGHLSFFPQLLTTLIKLVVGLSSYWPYLVCAFVVHLILVHLLWRLCNRVGAHPLVAILITTAFGVSGAGAENILWAFQVGFITPIATGIAAVLIVLRAHLRPRDIAVVTGLLVVGLGSSGTAVPMTVVVLALLWSRHGWRALIWPAGTSAVLYGTWYLVFTVLSDDPGGGDHGPNTVGELLIRVPEYVVRGLADSIGKATPLVALGPALLVLLVVWTLWDLRGARSARDVSAAHYVALGAVVFALLTALSRVQLGVESASSGRYVYMYAALLVPTAALLISRLIAQSRVAATVAGALLAVLVVYNAGTLVLAAQQQAGIEQSVRRAMSAAVALDDGSEEISGRFPAALWAPTLTMTDIRAFVDRGIFMPGEYGEQDLLDARVNLFLAARSVADSSSADPATCHDAEGAWVDIDVEADLVLAPTGGLVTIHARQDDLVSQFTQIAVPAGVSELSGLPSDIDIAVEQADAGGVCVFPRG